MADPLLEIRGLTTSFPGAGGRVPVVDGIDLQIARGEALALVGESGCGKSMTALSILRLVPKPGRIEPESHIRFAGQDLLALPITEMREIRGDRVAMIFQEPMSSLNPVESVGRQVVEAIRLHERVSFAEAQARVESLFERVRIPDPRASFNAYPHQLSGGLRQRVMIAMAVAMGPELLIADEPTTAVDVTVQSQILELLAELRRDLGTALLLITHDLGVVNELADRVAVMYAGEIIERGERREILGAARHPYTQGLMRSIPSLSAPGERLQEIEGVVPAPADWPPGCRFSTRCPKVFAPCRETAPADESFSASHRARCHALSAEAEA